MSNRATTPTTVNTPATAPLLLKNPLLLDLSTGSRVTSVGVGVVSVIAAVDGWTLRVTVRVWGKPVTVIVDKNVSLVSVDDDAVEEEEENDDDDDDDAESVEEIDDDKSSEDKLVLSDLLEVTKLVVVGKETEVV